MDVYLLGVDIKIDIEIELKGYYWKMDIGMEMDNE